MSIPHANETHSPERAIEVLARAADLAQGRAPTGGVQPPRPTTDELAAVPVVVLREHLDRLLVGKDPEPGLDALQESGALAVWLPEVEQLVGFGDGEWRHKDVWKHTKQVVRQSVRRIEVRWGALLHDIGKPRTRRMEDGGQVSFHGHAEVGAAMFRRRVSRRLGFSGVQHERVHFLILHHLRASQYDRSWTDSAVRRFYRQMGDGLTDLLDLSRADITTKRPERRRRGVRQIAELSERIRQLKVEDAKVPPLPKGLGNLLMERFGIPPSRQLGDIIRALTEDVESGRIEGQRDAEYYAAFVDDNRARFGL